MAGEITWVSGKRSFFKLRTQGSDDGFGWMPAGDWSFPISAAFLKRNVMRLDAAQGLTY